MAKKKTKKKSEVVRMATAKQLAASKHNFNKMRLSCAFAHVQAVSRVKLLSDAKQSSLICIAALIRKQLNEWEEE
jgi:hypothetical protein